MLLPWKRCSGDFSCSLANGSYDPMSLHRNLRKTLIKNLELLHAHQSELASHDCIRYVEQSVAHLTNNLAQLRKDSENNQTRNNIVEVMKFLFNDNDELDIATDNLFRPSTAMFPTTCHYMVARVLIRYAHGYTDPLQRENGIDVSFKRNKNIPFMGDFPLARREAPTAGRRPAGEGANIDRRLVAYTRDAMRIKSRIEFIYLSLISTAV